MSSTFGTKMKTFSLTHIVSIVAILTTVIATNAIYFVEAAKSGALVGLFGGAGVMWLSFFNIAGIAGMSYYAYRVAVSSTGLTVDTVPSTATPAAQGSTATLTDSQVQQIVTALAALKSPASTTTTP